MYWVWVLYEWERSQTPGVLVAATIYASTQVGPASQGVKSRTRGRLYQRQLGPAIERLDARLLAAGGAAIGHRDGQRELHGQPRAGVRARPPGGVPAQALVEIDGPARVERAVAAAQQIHPCLGHDRGLRRRRGDPYALARAPPRRRADAGTGSSCTGLACRARRRTSRQLSPSVSSAGAPMMTAVAISTACRMIPNASASAAPTPYAPCRTATQAAWKTPRFDGVAGSTAVTLTANSTAAAAPTPARSSSPSATSSA